MTFSDTTAGIGASFWTDTGTADGGRTDRRGSRNSYLDVTWELYSLPLNLLKDTH